MASRAFWFYVFAIPDIFNPPLCHSRRFQSGIHGLWGQTNERTEEKDTGFPLKTGGNDRGEGGDDERGEGGNPGAGAWSGHVVWSWGLTIS